MSASPVIHARDTLRQKAVSGLGWSAISQIVRQGTNLAVSLILARLLGPQAYGLIGMVTIFTGFGTLFVELGLGAGLIQRKELTSSQINAVFWVNVSMGILLAVMMFLAAPVIAVFYAQPQLNTIARVSSLLFVVGALGTVQNSLLSRQMQFKNLAKIDITATTLSGLLGLGMALLGFGVWSLVAQTLGLSSIRTVSLWWHSNWRPECRFRFAAVRDFVAFSGNLFGFNLFNYWVRNADNLLIGRFLGDQALGIYSRAYQLMVLPVYQISGVASNVMFPVLSSIQHDVSRVRSIYLRAIGCIHLVSAPVYVGLFVIAERFVYVVLGDRWLGLVPVLQILCTVGFFQPVSNSTGWLYTALGRTGTMFRWSVFSGLMYIAGFFVGIKWGLIGVTWSYFIVSWVFWYPCWTVAGRVAGLSFFDILIPLLPASICALIMGGGTWSIGFALAPSIPVALLLALQVVSGAAIYAGLVKILRLKSGEELVAIIVRRLRPDQSSHT